MIYRMIYRMIHTIMYSRQHRVTRPLILSPVLYVLSLLAMVSLVPNLAMAAEFARKGATPEYFDVMLEAFDISVLGDMLFNFYKSMRDENAVFDYLMAAGDNLLAPLLAPLVIICLSARLAQDMQDVGTKDIFGGLYATAAVVLGIAVYRILMVELTLASNALTQAVYPVGDSFENAMRDLEEVVEFFNGVRKNKDPIALLVDKSLSLYAEYFMAWGSKWGLMVLHGLLSYLRSTLFAINYVMGIFLLPFFIVKRNSLPRNWLKITAFLLLWQVVEAVMIAVMGKLGTSALMAALDVDAALPIFSESLFYVMVTTVNILIGVAMLSSVWIVKSYLLSPAAISSVATAFSIPAISLGYMVSNVGFKGSLAATGIARSTIGARNSGAKRKGGGGSYLPSPGDIFRTKNRQGGRNPDQTTRSKSGGDNARQTTANPDGSTPSNSLRKPYRMRSIIEHTGKLNKQSLPGNINAISRVGKKHKIK